MYPPGANVAIVDPAGLPFIEENNPQQAGGASGAIYGELGLTSFPALVTANVVNEGDAAFYTYPGKFSVIHVASPTLTMVDDNTQAQEKLTTAFRNVFQAFAGQQTATELRLLPISGGIYSGPFSERLPQMSAIAASQAFMSLDTNAQNVLSGSQVEMCIFSPQDVPTYQAAFSSMSGAR
mmetsp:Transcript_50925/g.164858  ORF Transcript_50925/g.164858 Transcript_50925/m.164858 type:complete len:180 (-) Transcript_50925:179-718(-)